MNKKKGLIKLEKYRSLFLPFVESGYLPMPMMIDLSKHFKDDYSFSFNITGAHVGDVTVKEFLKPLVDTLKTSRKHRKVFLCHASEDKIAVEDFAKKLKFRGGKVWFDKWEIKVGQSIVEKINVGLKEMTHLVIFLSIKSVNKPWVKKEFSSGLFRKLQDNSVQVIPILLEKVEIPSIITDIKYADCTKNKNKGFKEAIDEILS